MTKLGCALIGLVLVSAPAAAQDLRGQMSHCLAISGVLQRLSCYDGVAKAMGAAPAPVQQAYRAPPVAGQFGSERLPQAPMPAPAQARPAFTVDQFGDERLAKNRDAPKSSGFTSAIVEVRFSPTGKFILTLANGQIWRQIEGDASTYLHRRSDKTVSISRGAISSYNLLFNNSGSYYKVTRLQ